MANELDIKGSGLDEICKSILLKLKSNNFDKADVSYVTDESFIGSSELLYLLKHGAAPIKISQGRFCGVLHSFITPKHGPEVGKISFKLNFDLQ